MSSTALFAEPMAVGRLRTIASQFFDISLLRNFDFRSGTLRLHDVIRTLGKSGLEGPKPLDADTEARLRALGYVGSTVTPTAASLKNDPKDKLPLAMTLTEPSRSSEGASRS